MTRRAVAAALLAAGGLAAGGVLTGCGRTQAAPTGSPARTRVVLNYNAPWAHFPSVASAVPLLNQVLDTFRHSHPGIDLVLNATDDTGELLQQLLAGTAPDIIWSNDASAFIQSGLVLNLNGYIAKDNVDVQQLVTSQLQIFTMGGDVYALPAFAQVLPTVANLSVLNSLGKDVPQGSWTAAEWVSLAQQTTVLTPGKQRYGASIMNWPSYRFGGGAGMPSEFYFRGFGGGYVDLGDPARSALDSAGSIACADLLFPLLIERVATTDWGGWQIFGQNKVVIYSGWFMPFQAVDVFRGIEWDYVPMPTWPVAPATFIDSDFMAINAATKSPEAAWEVLRWLTFEPEMQQAVMRMTGLPPALKALVGTWEEVVRSIAPPLRGKNLAAASQLLLTDSAYPGAYFQYGNDFALGIIYDWGNRIVSRSVSPRAGLMRCAQQLNAYETAAQTTAGAQAAMNRLFPADGPPVASVAVGL